MIHHLFTRAALTPAAHPWPFLVLGAIGAYAGGCCLIEVYHARRRQRLYALHRASFAQSVKIRDRNGSAMAGSSRTPGALAGTA